MPDSVWMERGRALCSPEGLGGLPKTPHHLLLRYLRASRPCSGKADSPPRPWPSRVGTLFLSTSWHPGACSTWAELWVMCTYHLMPGTCSLSSALMLFSGWWLRLLNNGPCLDTRPQGSEITGAVFVPVLNSLLLPPAWSYLSHDPQVADSCCRIILASISTSRKFHWPVLWKFPIVLSLHDHPPPALSWASWDNNQGQILWMGPTSKELIKLRGKL